MQSQEQIILCTLCEDKKVGSTLHFNTITDYPVGKFEDFAVLLWGHTIQYNHVTVPLNTSVK